MKNIIVKFFNNPKLVAIVTIAISFVIGFIYYKSETDYLKQPPAVNAELIDNMQKGNSTSTLSLGFLTNGRIKDINVKVGDSVKKGDVLAALDPENTAGAVTQANAALMSAQANYQKVINGATGSDIDVLKTSVQKATINLERVRDTQNLLVKNAYDAYLNSGVAAVQKNEFDDDMIAPVISGSYTMGKEGDINLEFYPSTSGVAFKTTGLIETTGLINQTNAQPIGKTGLYIRFVDSKKMDNSKWIISLPNKKAPNYLANLNAYEAAKKTRDQSVQIAEADLAQAKSNLAAKAAAARPEDVASANAQVENAKGALQIAEAAYNSRMIKAPEDGVVMSVRISAGQIAVPNSPVIELSPVKK